MPRIPPGIFTSNFTSNFLRALKLAKGRVTVPLSLSMIWDGLHILFYNYTGQPWLCYFNRSFRLGMYLLYWLVIEYHYPNYS